MNGVPKILLKTKMLSEVLCNIITFKTFLLLQSINLLTISCERCVFVSSTLKVSESHKSQTRGKAFEFLLFLSNKFKIHYLKVWQISNSKYKTLREETKFLLFFQESN